MANIIKILKEKSLINFLEDCGIELKKVGKKFCCACPFHSEKTPSFYIDSSTNKWACFGSCQTSGDIIDFVIKYKTCSFAEGLEWLASKYDIPFNNKYVKHNKENYDEYYKICNFVCDFYSDFLEKPCSKLGTEYPRNRKLTRGIVRNFSLGYAPTSTEIGTWTSLTDSLKKQKFSTEICEEIGIIRKSQKDNYYDSFIGRIIFPIKDIKNRCIGFNSRILPSYDQDGPKYLLSKKTPIFERNNFIYGLNKTFRPILENNLCYIVEGCFDCFKMWSYGYKNTIPLLGGKFPESIPDVDNFIFLMDPDKAGIKYSIENGLHLIKQQKNVMICELSKDPDDCFKEEIDEAIINSSTFLEYYLKINFRYKNSIEHKLNILTKLSKLLEGISKEQIYLYALELEKIMDIPYNVLLLIFKLENNTLKN